MHISNLCISKIRDDTVTHAKQMPEGLRTVAGTDAP